MIPCLQAMVLTILFVFVFCIAVLDLTTIAWVRRKAKHQAEQLFANRPSPDTLLQAEKKDLDKLPKPLQGYLQQSNVLEHHAVQTVRMRQNGALRSGPGKSWRPLEAKCFSNNQAFAGLVWYADVTQYFLATRSILHTLMDSSANWEERIWGLPIPGSPTQENSLQQQLLLEYCGFMAWHPGSWLNLGLKWESLPNGDLHAQLANPEAPATLTMRFDEEGLLRSLSGPVGAETWTFSYLDFHSMQGLLVPLKWSVQITRDGQTWTFLQGQVTDIALNSPYSWW
ncbi:MAG: hypothetical protein IPK21_01495 [Haliscomenobacter sp.]|nr:hypothetical protein [Haliscomenobacter sp.]